jgi:hypothetical protein
LLVDGTHHADLMVALLIAALINTDGINPEVPIMVMLPCEM